MSFWLNIRRVLGQHHTGAFCRYFYFCKVTTLCLSLKTAGLGDRRTDKFEHHHFKWIEKDCNFVTHKAAKYSLCCNFSFYFNKTNFLGIIDFVYKANNGWEGG